jgi:colicin import membrane protein
MAMTTATAGGPYRVPKQHDGFRSLTLALAMHAVLFAFLWIGVRWQNTQPVGVDAEIWDLTTQMAAPKAPEPEPQPEPEPTAPPPREAPPPEVAEPVKVKEPDIALQRKKEKEKQEKLAEQKKLDEKKKKQEQLEEDKRLADQKKKDDEKNKKLLAQKEADKAAKAREAEMKRIMGSAAAGSTGTAAKSTAPRLDNGFLARLRTKIMSNIAYGGGKQDIEARFIVTVLPTGDVISVRKTKSSGVAAYDTAVENAINKSSPLPTTNGMGRELEITFNLKDLP